MKKVYLKMKCLLVFILLNFVSVKWIVESRECTEWEEFVATEAHCAPTCDFPEGITPCPQWQNTTSGCICKSGLVRGYKGLKCIEPDQCDDDADNWGNACDPDYLRYEPLNAHCEPTCADLEGVQPCPERFVAGCVCLEGFVRSLNAAGQQCIAPEDCDPMWYD